MPQSNLKQALKPEGAVMLSNPIGTAPGIWLEHRGQVFIALPGPPKEFRLLWQQHIVPRLAAAIKETRQVIYSRVLRICGKGESALDEELSDLLHGINPTVAPLAQLGEVHLRLTAKAGDEKTALELCRPVEKEIRRRLGWHLYGVDGQSLEEAVGSRLAEEGLSISVAESCTGGLLAHRLTNVSGSSRYFQSGLVTYSNRQKEKLLGVGRRMLKAKGAVSEEVAVAMAKGARACGETGVGLGITGIAGPAGGSAQKPVGLVYLALDIKGKIVTRRAQFWGEREQIKELAAQNALVMLWRELAQTGEIQ